MSNIQVLIDTVQAEGLQTRDTLSTQFSWFEYMNDNLVAIRESIVSIQERIFTFFDEEQARFDEAQRDLKAARRAEAERLKEAKAKGFTTPAKTSDGKVAETPTASDDSGGGLFAGLGITGLLAGIGAALSGYVAGIVNNLIKFITLGKMDGPKIIGVITKAMSALKEKVLLNVFRLQYFLDDLRGKLPKLTMPQGLVNAGKSITAFFTENKIGQFLSKVGNLLKTIGASLVSVFDMRPLMDAVKAIGGGPGGGILSKIGSFFGRLGGMFKTVFTFASKIAVPITAIIAAVKAIFSSFKEFDDDMGFFEKYMIFVKNLFKEIVSGFVTMPLELIKDGISTIAGWLGFDGVEEYLDSFDIDQIFRDSVDSIFNWLKEAINYVGDLVYQGRRKLGLADVDPEAEARIAAREVRSARDDLAEADARVQQLEETVSSSPAGSRERNEAQRQLKNARDEREERAKDLQEAGQAAAEAQVFGATALDESTQDASLQAAIDSGLYIERGIGDDSNIRISKLAETTDVNQLKAIINDNDVSPKAKQMVLDRIKELESSQPNQPTPSADQLQEVTVPSRETRSETPPSARPTLVASRVEPLSDLTNVTNINQATTAMQAAISSIIPSEAGDLNLPGQEGIDGALSPAGIMGAGLGAVIDGVKNLTSLPVAQASQEVAAAKDKPQVVALSGGSNSQVVNNTTNQQTVNMGAMSARSQDISNQRLADNMMA